MVATGAVEPARRAWRQHEVRIENRSRARMFLDDTRTSKFLDRARSLLAADDGCGYGASAGDPWVEPACRSNFIGIAIPAHGSFTTRVSLWRDLAGMTPLEPGEYVFRKIVRYGEEGPFSPGQRPPKTSTGMVTLTYDVG